MAATLDVLTLGNCTIDRSFFVSGRKSGKLQTVPVYAFLVRGAGPPILVDSGMRHADMINRLGMRAEIPAGETLDAQLSRIGLGLGDVGMIVQTHLHADHSGGIRLFAPDTPVVVNRSELAFGESGTQGLFYPPEDLAELRARDAAGYVRYLDVERDGQVEIAPGVVCEHAGGHTPGMMFVRVATADGVATICSDVVYDVHDQLVRPMAADGGVPEISNNTTWPADAERAAIRRALEGTDYLLPSHCTGARICTTTHRVVGMLDELRVPCGHTAC